MIYMAADLYEDKNMSIEKVRAYFRQYGIEAGCARLRNPALPWAAAMALGCEPKRIT